ncbi:DUF1236 domain-containing protein [Hyphomicrobium sp.]|uniref:DUF1236 domain-containing protein n=1 Tax=Hyphomicrobium sp. TaxID=82 RepID=UPI000F91B20C|nr:DUF1236 domain-containing protein [Hyphomicrobium sp.]RUP08646.1 MAG: DUF1236 domain-containing protein [Hyphomicrobium sp.]
MLKYSIAIAALLAASPLAAAEQMDRGDKGAGANSAAEHAPGKMKEGSSSKDLAPSQRKEEGSSAKEASPSKLKENSASRSDESGNRKADNDKSQRSDKAKDDTSRAEVGKGAESTGASEGATGRTGGKASITGVTEEQRAKVKSVFTQHHVEPARGLNVSVNIGVALPHSVHLYPVPAEIVTIVPEYRGYEYILLEDNRVAIVDPATFEVVDIIIIA